ncbi:oligosaccharide flippase family protein [Cobetia sp. 3AK]|uniref:lipopolysaccharide biosynthesis protein n=1 Tax=Cobetia sp. 3AK TaxID=3040020 RepID=UPI0024482FF5|nr:oligosaccharide flippase family protein [Cobetia sp. 3AK]MDH2373877.1 oligosaccharide flippase family protein [Cobetia sp. 3AK]
MFLKNVSLVAAGTGVAQAITIATTPIITRIYGPEAFGVVGLFTAILAITTPLSAFSYPIAIVLPKNDFEAIKIAKLSFYLALLTSISTLLCLLVYSDWIVNVFDVAEIKDFLFLIPIAMLFAAVYAILSQWVVRNKLFNLKAKASIVHSIIFNLSKAGAGLISPIAAVLVTITSFSNMLHSVIIFRGLSDNKAVDINSESEYNYKDLFVKYKDFLVYRTPQVFLNALSQSIPVIMLTSFFGATAAGFYSLAKLALAAPSALLGEAVSSVFYPKFNESFRDDKDALSLFLKATFLLATIGLAPFSLIVVFGSSFFAFIFGTEWGTSGEYAQWMAVWLYFGFVNRPSVAAIPVLKMQGYFLVYEVFSVILRVVSIIIGFYVFNSGLVAIALFSLVGVILNITLIVSVLLKILKENKAQSI